MMSDARDQQIDQGKCICPKQAHFFYHAQLGLQDKGRALNELVFDPYPPEDWIEKDILASLHYPWLLHLTLKFHGNQPRGPYKVIEVVKSFIIYENKDTNAQIEMACGLIRDDPKLQNGFNALGFSQVK